MRKGTYVDPTKRSPKWLWWIVAVLLVILFLIVAVMSQFESAPPDPYAKVRELTCDGDVTCAGSRAQWRAEQACLPLIEAQAQYEVRWVGEKLPLGRWSERYDILKSHGPERVIQYEGSGALFQNGFGAWNRLRYECDFDVVGQEVVAARIFE